MNYMVPDILESVHRAATKARRTLLEIIIPMVVTVEYIKDCQNSYETVSRSAVALCIVYSSL